MQRATHLAVLAVLVGCMGLRLWLALVYEINWDEFLNLSMVHDAARGTLDEPLQTLFVRGFGWLARISVNEVDQIVAARLVMLGAVAATVALIVWTARGFMPLHAALFAGLCFAAFSFGLRQGTTFRTDTMATTLVMAAIAVLVRRPRAAGWAAGAGAAMGLAGMVTIKAIFHAPAVAAICLARLIPARGRGQAFRLGVVVAVAASGVFAVLFVAHRAGLEAPASAAAFLERTTGKTLADVPGVLSRYWLPAIRENLVFALALAAGLGLAIRRVAAGPDRAVGLVLLALALPLASLGYYSESYPYFFPFVLAPASVLAGLAIAAIPGAAGLRITLAAALLVGAQTVLTGSALLGRDNAWQRRVLDVVHRMFPAPVAYIDHASMVASFPKTGFFMSAWGLSDYYAGNRPVIADMLRRDRPAFILVNQPMLSFERLDPERAGPGHGALLAGDIQALRQNFIPHWGPIAIAGKRFELIDGVAQAFGIVIPGPYTVEADGPVVIDATELAPGAVIDLAAGPHTIAASGSATVTLRWGDHIYRPAEPVPDRALFTGF